jgi:endonuclease/exonuclease/phosphatase family metal-dependent hydrolase
MLYRPEKFTPVETKYIGIRFPFEPEARTRDILYVKGVVLKKDTLHLFVNHWPSRFGGHQATIPKREFVAQQLRRLVDSLMVADQGARILIMGDLNDEPTDPSVSKVLNATQDSLNLAPGQLYNMMTGAGSDWNYGTIKDKELWITIDQFIVSSSLLKRNEGLHTVPHWIRIMNPPFLLQKDDAWFGQKPFRTYYGFEYIGGFSDHLPIYMDLKY